MTNEELLDKIKAEIEKRIALMKELVEREGTCDFALGSIDALQGLLDTVISPIFDEEVREHIDLEEAAEKYAYGSMPDEMKSYVKPVGDEVVKNFIAGANWQAEQLLKSSPLPEDTVLFNKGVEEGRRLERDEFEKNRLAACSNQTKEEYDRETDFALEIIKKEHRQPTFSDAINYGMRLQKEQMMDEWLKDRDGCFWDGVNEGKKAMEEQMMNGARNHFVYNILSGNDMKKMIEIYNDEADCRPGDVVRVIIVKE